LAPPNRGSINNTHIHGTHVPVVEPSTASEADAGAFMILNRKYEGRPACLILSEEKI
jgi:hypothetical protein